MKHHIDTLRTQAKRELNLLSGKCNDGTKVNSTIAFGLATYLAFKVLDVPSDKGIIPRQYYMNNLMSTVDEIVSAVNEACPIAHKEVIGNCWSIWYSRYLFLHGDVSEERILDFLDDSPTLSKDQQVICELREDLLY